MDFYVQPDGQIRTYSQDVYNIDHITPGRPLLLLWQQTKAEKYRNAAQILRQQLAKHPRTKEGGFWHKKRYPWQMWLDGLYMGEPFYAEYSLLFQEAQNFDDIANQFIWMEKNAREPKSGLLYHAWDESREQRWANKNTGQSPHFWGRAMGWYAMALVDVLDYFPKRSSEIPVNWSPFCSALQWLPPRCRMPKQAFGIRCSTSQRRQATTAKLPLPACSPMPC